MTEFLDSPTKARFGDVGLREDYDRAADFYDGTRGASPSLMEAMLQQLGPARGRSLLEVGCGTGNYASAFAAAGFRVIGLDLSQRMLRGAAGKLEGRVARADAQQLPMAARSVDCVVTINATHHFPDLGESFREFHRVARDRTVHHMTAEEQFRSHWALHYFPLQRYEAPGEHPSRDALVTMLAAAGFCDVEAIRFDYRDTVDASLMPLRHASPSRLCDASQRAGISAFRRLSAEEDAAGEAALAADLGSGRFAAVRERYDATWQTAGDSMLLAGRVRRSTGSGA